MTEKQLRQLAKFAMSDKDKKSTIAGSYWTCDGNNTPCTGSYFLYQICVDYWGDPISCCAQYCN